MTSTFLSSFLDALIIILASLSQIFRFGCHVRHVRMALLHGEHLSPRHNSLD